MAQETSRQAWRWFIRVYLKSRSYIRRNRESILQSANDHFFSAPRPRSDLTGKLTISSLNPIWRSLRNLARRGPQSLPKAVMHHFSNGPIHIWLILTERCSAVRQWIWLPPGKSARDVDFGERIRPQCLSPTIYSRVGIFFFFCLLTLARFIISFLSCILPLSSLLSLLLRPISSLSESFYSWIRLYSCCLDKQQTIV